MNIRSLVAAYTLAAATSALPLRAQQQPFDWRNRTLVGGSYARFTTNSPSYGVWMAAIHVSHITDRVVAPDFTGAVHLGGAGSIFATLDLGIGSAVDIGGSLALANAGVGVAIAPVGEGAVLPDLQVSAAFIGRVSDRTGVRLDAGRRWYVNGTAHTGFWLFGFGLTGLGRHR